MDDQPYIDNDHHTPTTNPHAPDAIAHFKSVPTLPEDYASRPPVTRIVYPHPISARPLTSACLPSARALRQPSPPHVPVLTYHASLLHQHRRMSCASFTLQR
jgi:hypothetical protein